MEGYPQPAGFSPHSVRLAGILALAYLLVVVYASLHPFHGWRTPPEDVLRFLTAAWPHFITLEDVLVNFCAYVPLGLLLSVSLGALGPARGALAATAAATAVSLAMEAAQMFLPARIASNVDLLANGAGALMGALAAPLLAPGTAFGARLHALRHRLFAEGLAADAALVVAGLWLLAQLHTTVQLFGSGDLRETLALASPFRHTATAAFTAEALTAFFNVCAIGLLLFAFMREGAARWRLVAGLVSAALTVRLLAGAELLKLAFPLGQLTPGVVTGTCAAGAVLYGARRAPRAVQLGLSLACVAAALVVINAAPANPYLSVPRLLLAPGAGHVLSLTAIVRALSEIWPLLAIAFIVWSLARGEGRRHGRPRAASL